MSSELPSNAPPAQPHWTLNLVIVLGIYWAVNRLVPVLTHGITGPFDWLPLLGFASPFLRKPGIRWFKGCAILLCFIQVLVSGLMYLASMVSYMDPLGFQVRVLGIPVTMLEGLHEQLIYLVGRAALFFFAGVVITKHYEREYSPSDFQ